MKEKIMMTLLLSLLLTIFTTGSMIKEDEPVEIVEEPINEVVIEKVVEPEEEVVEKEPVVLDPDTYFGLTEDELNLIYAVVMQEGGPTYESAEAVMSTIVNRVNNPDKWGWAGDTIIDQITYPQQYCYSLDDYWVKYLNGNVPDEVKWAVWSVLEYGPAYEYDCFRGYYLEGCEYIGGNWYFVG